MISTSSISGDSWDCAEASARWEALTEADPGVVGEPATSSAALLVGRKRRDPLGVGLLRAGVLREVGTGLGDRDVAATGKAVLARCVARVGVDVGALHPLRPLLQPGVEQLVDVLLARRLSGRLAAGL